VDLVSTIIPVYNRAAMLREAVESVLAQTYRPIQVLIVDDGSTDDTPAVADSLAAEHPGTIRVLHQHNTGPGPARQAGLEASSGELVQFLDSDDLLLPDKFSREVAALRNDPDAGIAYGIALLRDEATGWTAPTHGTDVGHRELFPAVLSARLWPTAAPLYRREVCEAIGSWADLRVLEDWDYDCRAGLLGVRLCYRSEPGAVIRRHGHDHAGLAWQRNPVVWRDRVAAFERVFGYAEQAGLGTDSPEMRHFARSAFLVARQCGAAGLPAESARLFRVARRAAGGEGLDYLLYRAGAFVLGWTRMGRLSGWLDSVRS
jgi:cellulose synthase/poly-beta-1,6-N-acetylglucosamine synthase-like glycosyltransferase